MPIRAVVLGGPLPFLARIVADLTRLLRLSAEDNQQSSTAAGYSRDCIHTRA
jgi:hypothetical protein